MLGLRQAGEQADSFSVKAAGLGFVLPFVAVKPRVTEPAGAIVAVYDAEVTLTSAPLWVAVPPHRLLTR